MILPKKFRSYNMYSGKILQKDTVLDEFVGKFQALESINCVNLKHDFKNQEV